MIANTVIRDAESLSPAGLARCRNRALAAARNAYAAEHYGTEHRVYDDSVTYVVTRRGVVRIESGPDGQRLSERHV